MEKVITFIVPAYNVEQYLDKCLSSFICPSVMKKIEVIVINDGSTDRTESLAQRYANSHPDSFAVINQKNGGHGSVINLGSQLAKGRYFKVIDSNFAHRFCLCTLKIQYLAGIRLSKFHFLPYAA